MAYNLSLYKYFIGRIGQSVSKDIMARNIGHHEIVVKTCVEYYLNKSGKDKIGNKWIYFLMQDLSEKVDRQYRLILFSSMSVSMSFLKEWDRFIVARLSYFHCSTFRILNLRKRFPLWCVVIICYLYKTILNFKNK